MFYDAPEGQARVLGGGFIQSTLSMTHAARIDNAEARLRLHAAS